MWETMSDSVSQSPGNTLPSLRYLHCSCCRPSGCEALSNARLGQNQKMFSQLRIYSFNKIIYTFVQYLDMFKSDLYNSLF